MKISKRKYYCNFYLATIILGVLVLLGTPLINKYTFKLCIAEVNRFCKYGVIALLVIMFTTFIIMVLRNGGIRNLINRYQIINSIEDNLISIGAYIQHEDKVYLTLPKIKVKNNTITIKLTNLYIRSKLQKYIEYFSTSLPENIIVQDYYFSQGGDSLILVYENLKNYKPEKYTLAEYIKKIQSLDLLDLYFDKKHIVNLNDYPHWLISGSTGSGKSYLVNQLVIQAIVKGFEVVILDLKRSYGLYKDFTEYYYEIDDILESLRSLEQVMYGRLEKLQPALDNDPRTLAVDIGYKPKLVVIEEYISLQSALDKKQKEELERIVKNLSVLARQTNIHLILVMQSAGTENINSTTRSNLTKVLLGNTQSNILTATFGNGVDIPNVNTKLNKGEGLIQLDRITMLRIPEITDIENFNSMNLDEAVV